MDQESNNKIRPVNGVEIYAKRLINNGAISSDTYAKIVTDEYTGKGKVVAESNLEQKQGGIRGVFFEVGGSMRQDGVIQTDKDAVVGVNVRGDYVSNKGKIIHGKAEQVKWHNSWWGISVITIFCGLIITFVAFVLGWNK